MAYEADRKLILAHQSLVRAVRDRVVSYAVSSWGGLGSWRDGDVDRFVARVVPAVIAGEKQVAQLTNAYLDSLARVAGFPVLPGSPVVLSDTARGVPMETVYGRPGVTLYTALSEGKTLDEAILISTSRLVAIVAMDLQLAATRTAHGRMKSADGIAGYRRVLTGRENCALCALASTQRYHRGDLMPIHPGCDCTVAPIYGDHDPGRVINDELYEETMRVMRESGVTDTHSMTDKNRDISRLMTVRNHGEYGPTLTWRYHKFTGPSDIG